MAAIDLTPAQVNTELARTASRNAPETAPPLDDATVSIRIYKPAGAPARAEVLWSPAGGVIRSADFEVTTAIPVGDRAALRVALGRLLVAAREQVGAT